MATVIGQGVRTVYSGSNVNTTTWLVLFNALPLTVSSMTISDLSGQTMEIGICDVAAAPNSEVRQFLVPPGGVSVKVQIPPTQRVSIRAVSNTANTGENNTNVLF